MTDEGSFTTKPRSGGADRELVWGYDEHPWEDEIADSANIGTKDGRAIVNQDPTAAFTVTPDSGDTGTDFVFDASGSSDPEESTLTFDWDFGDGDGASGESVTKSFTNPSTYAVTLTVTDEYGNMDSVTQEVSVESALPGVDDFESYSVGESPSAWPVTNGAVTNATASEGAQSFANNASTSDSGDVFKSQSFDNVTPNQITFAYRETGDSKGVAYKVYNPNGMLILAVGSSNPAVECTQKGGIQNDVSPMYGEWRRFTITFDWPNEQFDVYWEDLTGSSSSTNRTGVGFVSSASGIGEVIVGGHDWRNGGSGSPQGYEWWDDIWGAP